MNVKCEELYKAMLLEIEKNRIEELTKKLSIDTKIGQIGINIKKPVQTYPVGVFIEILQYVQETPVVYDIMKVLNKKTNQLFESNKHLIESAIEYEKYIVKDRFNQKILVVKN